MKSTDHIITRMEGGVMEYLRCKATLAIKFPVRVDDYVAAAESFINNHKDCEHDRART